MGTTDEQNKKSNWTQPLRATSATNSLQGAPSFSLGNRVYRAAWQVTWALFASWTPPPLHRWRAFLLRCFGANLGRNLRVYGSARIWSPVNLTVGDYVCIGPRANVYAMAPIRIGSHSVISQDAELCGGTHLVDDPNFQLVTRPISIGERAWVAAHAFVGPGVSVGTGAVLGAHACAMRDLEPWVVYSGNPAVKIRERKFAASD